LLAETKAQLKMANRWTDEEHSKFLGGLAEYGRNWVKVSEVVGTRTTIQVRSHAQKYLQKQEDYRPHDINPQPPQRQRLEGPMTVPDISSLRKAIPVLDPATIPGFQAATSTEEHAQRVESVSSSSESESGGNTVVASDDVVPPRSPEPPPSPMAPPPAREKRAPPSAVSSLGDDDGTEQVLRSTSASAAGDDVDEQLPPPPAGKPGLLPSCSSLAPVDDDAFGKLSAE
jgi:SHAQKYF class myb-like DNA-binding protein